MATSGPSPTLIAAFTFGNLFNTAAAALFLHVKGHGSTVIRDGKRLALVTFLISVALWAQIEFATELIDPTSTQACQVGIIFTTTFDQLARLTIEQFTLWVIFDGVRVSTARTTAHILLFARLALGVVFVALSRPAFDTTCVALSSSFPVALAVVVADGLIIAALATLAFINRNANVENNGEKQKGRGKSMALLIGGMAFWLGTSVIMLLGFASSSFILRSVVPASGLSILLIFVTSIAASVMGPGLSDREQRLPEAPSPRPIMQARSYSTSASVDYDPPSRYEDLKIEQLNSMTAFVQPREVPVPGHLKSVQPAMLMGSRGMTEEEFIQEQMTLPFQTTQRSIQPVLSNAPKKSLFNSSNKTPASGISVGKLAISYPMLQEGGSNPLDKVATMDLATAAQLEKEKRALLAPKNVAAMQADAVQQGSSGIPPGFSAPPTRAYRTVSPQNSLTRVPTVVRTEAIAQQQNEYTFASATGASLSPASDELRRRSPKQSPTNSSTGSSTTLAPKTPVQQRPTAGLPMNPRSRSVRKAPENPESMRQETVMFVNNIVYDDPEYVASVMDTAKDRGRQPFVPAPFPVDTPTMGLNASYYSKHPSSAVSIVNRPRPIPRKHREEEGSFYPHRRTRSAGSLLTRKSLLRYEPDSPIELPPLPPPPQSIDSNRPQPNDTKSMTFDEKLKLLVHKNNGPSERQYKRRSSLPIMERSFIDDSPTLADSEARDTRAGGSKRTTATAQLRIFSDEQDQSSQRGVSYNTYQGFIDEPDNGANSPESHTNMGMVYNVKRASSPLLPVFAEVQSASSAMSSDYEDITNTYSPLPIQQIGLTVQQARAVEVNMKRPSDNRAASAITNSEEMTIMLDSSVIQDAQMSQNNYLMPPQEQGNSWHRRIGDEALSFSTLSDKRGSRRGPPPQALVLSVRPTPAKQAAMLKAVEPSPLPSPGEALKKIEAQLKKYEVVSQTAFQSPGRQALLNELEAEMGMQETQWRGMQHDYSRDSLSTVAMTPTAESRRTSLANGPRSQQNLSRKSSLRSNLTPNWSDSRRSRLASLLSQRSSVNSMEGVPPGSRATIWQQRLAQAEQEFMQSTQDPSRRLSINFLHLSSQSGSPSLFENFDGPESVTGRSEGFPIIMESQPQQEPLVTGLWTAPQATEILEGLMWTRPEKPYHVSVAEPTLPGLFVRPPQRKEISTLSIQSSQLWQKRVSQESSSFGLWNPVMTKSVEPSLEVIPSPSADVVAFYKSNIEASRTASSSRPLTQRPPRRSKRFTSLADIIEDPQPLPNKRDTLGIFQFPWGEKSDTPFITQRTRGLPMTGMMSSENSAVSRMLEAKSEQIAEIESSSFFDDGDDDDEEILDDSSSMGSESGDEFDDTTLFKIATLLQADNVPSTNSFFGAPRDSTGSDLFYDYYEESSEESENSDRQTIFVGIEEGDDELQEMPMSRPRPSMLWETTSETRHGDSAKGLPQPENWQVYDVNSEPIRARPRVSTQPATIASDSLWTKKALKLDTSEATMWSANSQAEVSYFDESPPESPSDSERSELATPDDIFLKALDSRSSLWQFEEQPQQGDHDVGLPQTQDWPGYETEKSSIRSKPRQSKASSIESFDLWTVPAPAQLSSAAKMWKASSQPTSEEALPPHSKASNGVKTQTSALLWSVPSVVKESVDIALFELGSGRTVFRTTAEAPAALLMQRKHRLSATTSPAFITSTSLWVAAPTFQTRINWLGFKSKSKSESESESKQRQLLWSALSMPKIINPSGLFVPNSGRTEFRTTTQSPAGVRIARKSRATERASPESLSSLALWAPNLETKAERNWLVNKTSSKQTTSKKSSSSSAKQLMWSAPAAFKEDAKFALFNINAGRKDFRTTDLSPAAIQTSRKSHAAGRKPLEVLSSTALWAAEAQRISKPNWILANLNNIKRASLHSVSSFEPVVDTVQAVVVVEEAVQDDARMVAAAPTITLTTAAKATAVLPESESTVAVEPIVPKAGPVVSKAIEAAPRPPFTPQPAQRGRKGARISAMASRFESSSQSRSVSRDSYIPVSVPQRTDTSRAQSAAPVSRLHKEEEVDKPETQTDNETEEVSEVDAAFYAQIEALERKREQAMMASKGEEDDEEQGEVDELDAAFYAQIEALEKKRGAVEQLAVESHVRLDEE
ncbi:hypothetical protein BD289DRAFT_484592 [Coniella lustricola]|uniref:Uncharacterized protein n=1 Tax=Coniella lustricola TaxID=2025994 RepID=A0A2T3A1G3_9PEZI|nr:hypothetical protein BD289DRAFT_484592 [Coniella lustricola]